MTDRSPECLARELGEVSTRVDMLCERLQWQTQDKAEMFRRIGTLENRMAQVTIVATMAALVVPVALTLILGN